MPLLGVPGGVTVRVPQLPGWRKTPRLGRAAFSGRIPCNFPPPASVSHLMRGSCCRLTLLWEGLTMQQPLPELHEDLPRGAPWGCAVVFTQWAPNTPGTQPSPAGCTRRQPSAQKDWVAKALKYILLHLESV